MAVLGQRYQHQAKAGTASGGLTERRHWTCRLRRCDRLSQALEDGMQEAMFEGRGLQS